MQHLKTYILLTTIVIVLSFSTCSNSNKIEKEEKNKTFSFDSLYLRPTDTSDIHIDFARDIICYDFNNSKKWGVTINIIKKDSLDKWQRVEIDWEYIDEPEIYLLKDTTINKIKYLKDLGIDLQHTLLLYHITNDTDIFIYEEIYSDTLWYDNTPFYEKKHLAKIQYITQPYDELLADAQKEEKEDSFCLGHWSIYEKGYAYGISKEEQSVCLHVYSNNNINCRVIYELDATYNNVTNDTVIDIQGTIFNIGKDSTKIVISDSNWVKINKLGLEKEYRNIYYDSISTLNYFIITKNKAYQFVYGEVERIFNKMNFNKYYLYKYGFINRKKL